MKNIADQQLIDERTTVIDSRTSSLVANDDKTHLRTGEVKLVLAVNHDNSAPLNNGANEIKMNVIASSSPTRVSSTARFSTSTRPRYTTQHSSSHSGLSGWQIFLIVLGVLLCCCCGGSSTSKAKTGRWVPGYIWVEK